MLPDFEGLSKLRLCRLGKRLYFQYNLQHVLPGMAPFFVGMDSSCPVHLLSIPLASHKNHNTTGVSRTILKDWSRSMMSGSPSNMDSSGHR